MPKKVFMASTANAFSRAGPLPDHKSPSCPSLMARSFRIHFFFYRICGWFFIDNLLSTSESAEPRVVWKSWYTIYSCGCVALLLWIEQEVFVTLFQQMAQPEVRFKTGLRLIIQTTLFVRMAVNFICTLLGSSRLVGFYKRAAVFEKQIGILACDCCAPRRFFWSDIQRGCLCGLFLAVFTLTDKNYDPEQWPSAMAHNPFMHAYSWAKIVLSQFMYFNYDSIYAVSLRSSFQVLSEYLGRQLSILKDCTDRTRVGFSHEAEMAARVENVRLTISTVRQLKEEINDIWRWPLVVSSLCVLMVPCLCVHEACQEDFITASRYSMVLYAAYTAYESATLAYASQSLINKAKQIKDICKAIRLMDNPSFLYQVRYLMASIDLEDMSMKGADFFYLNMSTLVSMAGTVITYAVIVLQTSQTIDNSLHL